MNLISKSLMLTLSLAAFAGTLNAASLNDVYPTIQQVKTNTSTINASQLAGSSLKKPDLWPILEACKAKKMNPSGNVKIVVDEKGTTLKKKLKKLVPGAYCLEIRPNEIKISAADSTGVYYAAQTLAQMISLDGKIGCGEVVDFPDIPFRGSIEGFYGRVWSQDARASQLRFYGKYKMNIYVYSPKDDPFHRSKWREAYPEEKQKEFKELLEIAKKNHVYFTWTIHLGGNVNKNNLDAELATLRNKLESMYKIGFRAFGVLFDDFGAADGDLHVKLCNFVQKFSDEKGDCAPVLMCPTEYNRGWSPAHSKYLDVLGAGLDKRINVFWTGDSVCHDITASGTEWVNNRIKRNSYVWWNWPVVDYCARSLLLGRTYGLEPGNKGKLSGFASNPMDKPEASKIALFGVGDWTWNIDGFNSDKSWRDGIKRLFPTYHEAMQTLANHSSDQGKNGHGYRREESVAFKPLLDKAAGEIAKGKLSAGTAKALNAEFEKMQKASETLCKEIPEDNPELWLEIQCWVKNLGAIGRLGEAVVDMNTSSGNAIDKTAANYSRALVAYARQQKASDNQIQHAKDIGAPHQNPAVVGGLHVMPFLQNAMNSEWKQICKSYLGKEKAATGGNGGDLYKTLTNISQLQQVKTNRDGKYVKLATVYEQVKFNKGDYLGLMLPDGVVANYVHFTLDNAAAKQLTLEITTDGKTWKQLGGKTRGANVETSLKPSQKVVGARLINKSSKQIVTKINQAKLDIPEDSRVNSNAAVFDGDPLSYYTVSGKPVTFTAPNGEKSCLVFSSAPASAIKKEPGKVTISPVADKKNIYVFEILWK